MDIVRDIRCVVAVMSLRVFSSLTSRIVRNLWETSNWCLNHRSPKTIRRLREE
jgi:hypothetical protein